MHEHPTQALLDAFTIREHKGRLAGLKVAIVGDLLHSRVLRSNVLLLKTMGADVCAVRPGDADAARQSSGSACSTTSSMDEAVEGADVVMMLRIQQERMHGHFIPSLREYFTLFGLTPERLRRAQQRRDRDAPGADEPRRRDRFGSRRRPVLGDPRAGVERRGGADGGAVSAGGARLRGA